MSTSSQDAIEVAKIEDTSLLAFYRDMNVPERRTFWACASGWALDGMDFMIYPLVIGTIITMWKVDPGTAGLAGTVTLLASAIGGWLAGYLADRIGRVMTLQLTILWFSFFSLVCAFVQNFDQLLIARALLGLGFGGEWAAGAVLMGEAIRAQYRGRAVGSVQSGWAVGWGLAVLSQAVLFSIFPPETAWRWMFAVGALPALLVFFLRRYVEEPKIAAETRAKQAATGDRPQLWEIFSGPIAKTTILASLAATGCQGGYYAITFWVPRFLTTERHLSIVSSTGYLAALIIGSFIGYLVGAWLADRIGRRNLFLTFSIGAIALILALHAGAAEQSNPLGAGFPAGLLCVGIFLRHGRVPDRTVSDPPARIGTGLLLQLRSRHRRTVPVPGWLALAPPRRLATPSASSRCWLTDCSLSLPTHCPKPAAGFFTQMPDMTDSTHKEAPACPGPLASQHKATRFTVPPGAVDTHCHVIGLPPAYPFMPDRAYTPPEATARDYLAMLDATGMTYGVLTQVSVHGTDNRLMVDTLRANRERLRGIAVIALDCPERERAALKDAGVVGLRMNVLYAGGGVNFAQIENYACAMPRDGMASAIPARRAAID